MLRIADRIAFGILRRTQLGHALDYASEGLAWLRPFLRGERWSRESRTGRQGLDAGSQRGGILTTAPTRGVAFFSSADVRVDAQQIWS